MITRQPFHPAFGRNRGSFKLTFHPIYIHCQTERQYLLGSVHRGYETRYVRLRQRGFQYFSNRSTLSRMSPLGHSDALVPPLSLFNRMSAFTDLQTSGVTTYIYIFSALRSHRWHSQTYIDIETHLCQGMEQLKADYF